MLPLFLTFLNYIDRSLAGIEKIFVCISLTIMVLLGSLEVILRNFFHSGLIWGDILVRHMVLFILFFGASLCTRENRHIQMDLSAKLIPHRLKPVLGLFINSFCIFVTFSLFKAAFTFMLDEKGAGSVLIGDIPTWCFIGVIPLGFAMVSLRFSLNWIDNILVIAGLKEQAIESMPIH